MKCITLNNIKQNCEPQIGGVQHVILMRLAERGDAGLVFKLDTTHTFDPSNMPATLLNISYKAGSTEPDYDYFYNYSPADESSSLIASSTVDMANGIMFTENTLTLVFNGITPNSLYEYNQLTSMTSGEGYMAFVKLNNGKWYAIGLCDGLEAASGEGTTGAAKSDATTLTVGLKDNGPYIYMAVETYYSGAILDKIKTHFENN